MADVPAECRDCPKQQPLGSVTVCAQSDGRPIIISSVFECADQLIVSTYLDANTGAIISPEPVVPCDSRDWEVSTLCDVDASDGSVINVVLVFFEWNEATGALTTRLALPSDPSGTYVPTGVLRSCDTDEGVDVEWVLLCDDGTDPATPFFRRFASEVTNDTVVGVTVEDFELDGVTPYVVTGVAGLCPSAVTVGSVTIDLPTVEVTNCDDSTEMVSALPVAVEGRVEAHLCDDQLPLGVLMEYRVPKGHEKIVVSGVVVGLTVPAGADVALISNAPFSGPVGAVRWRDDGVAPTGGGTAGIGQYILPGVSIWYTGDLSSIDFIRDSAPKDGVLDITYYGP